MKKIYLLAAAALVLAGCTKDPQDNNNLPKGKYMVTASVAADPAVKAGGDNGGFEVLPWDVQSPATKTHLGDETASGVSLLWSADDEIAVLPVEGTGFVNFYPYTLASGADTKIATFSGVDPLAAGTTYRAFYPASSTRHAEGGVANISMGAQHQSSNGSSAHLSNCAIMYSDPVVAVAGSPSATANFKFNYLVSLLQFSITVSNYTGFDPVQLKNIWVTDVSEDADAFNGGFWFGAQGMPTTSETSNAVDLECPHTFTTSGTDATYTALMAVSTDAVASGRPLQIVIETNRGVYYFDKAIPAGGFVAGKRYKTSLNVDLTMPTAKWEWVSTDPWPPISGGTITISSAKDLAWVSGVSNGTIADVNIPRTFEGYTLVMANSIDLTGKLWTKIGSVNVFSGTFDGDDYGIYGLTINSPDAFEGLFSQTAASAVIKNLTITSGRVISSGNDVGALVGSNNGGIIEGCTNDGCSVNGNISIGGIAGQNTTGSIIRGCINRAAVKNANVYCGGIAGYDNGLIILACLNTGNIEGAGHNTGGITGGSFGSSIIACVNGGRVSFPSGTYSGSLTGSIEGGTVSTCWYPQGTTAVWYGSGTTNLFTFNSPSDVTVDAMNTELGKAYNVVNAGGWSWKERPGGSGFPEPSL